MWSVQWDKRINSAYRSLKKKFLAAAQKTWAQVNSS